MNKMKSRTFWLAVLWTGLVPLGWAAQAFFRVEVAGAIITAAGAVVTAYIGKRGLENHAAIKSEKNE